MSRRTLLIAVVAVITLLPALNRPVLAHHSGAAFGTNELTLKGTVAEYDWGNPHVLVVWDVKDDGGKVTRWSGELASVSSMLADGMTKSSLKPGDDVIMTVHPAKSGNPQSVIVQIRRGDGTMLLAWSRRGGGAAAERAAREAEGKPVTGSGYQTQ